jgi:large subunit ribosomal protein L4
MSARNIQKNKVISAMDLNTYDVLNAAKLVLVEGSLSVIEKNLSK